MLKDLLQELIETLSGIKELRYVATDWGQLDYEQPPVQWPCALIDIPGLQCSGLSGASLMNEGTVTIQLVNQPPQRTSARAPKAQQDANMVLFGLIDRIYELLHGVDSERHTPLVLKSVRVHDTQTGNADTGGGRTEVDAEDTADKPAITHVWKKENRHILEVWRCY